MAIQGEPGDSLVTFELFLMGTRQSYGDPEGLETFRTPAYARKNFRKGWTTSPQVTAVLEGKISNS
jgi:hypothetical protein